MLKFSHDSIIALEEIADPVLCDEINNLSENDSICEEIENEIYSLIHFGRSEVYKIDHLKKLQPIECNRYFQSTTTCYRCNQTGHLARECNRPPPGCHVCKRTDHKKSDCPRYFCKLCKRYGHTEPLCPLKKGNMKCNVCESKQHKAADCPKEKEKALKSQKCVFCGKSGHARPNCPVLLKETKVVKESQPASKPKKAKEEKSKNKKEKSSVPSEVSVVNEEDNIKKGKKKKKSKNKSEQE
ncbi:hypothetical protein NEIG_01015 [Nematocida sp. ERTm5]|nr:hypothetical protein NEIG_01015 [Nematocida sp. ERTm5]